MSTSAPYTPIFAGRRCNQPAARDLLTRWTRTLAGRSATGWGGLGQVFRRVLGVVLGLAVVTAGSLAVVAGSEAGGRDRAAPAVTSPAAEVRPAALDAGRAYGVTFEANHGQADAAVRFLSRQPGYDLFITPTETVMTLHALAAPGSGKAADPPAGRAERAALRMSLVGANAAPAVAGAEPLPGKVNYLIGSDPAGWHTAIPTFGRVNLTRVYTGIDVSWYGGDDGLEYDLVVAPGADPAVIRLAVAGAAGPLRLDDRGNLLIDTPAGTVIQQAPVTYQQVSAGRRPVPSAYTLFGDDELGFSIGDYDPARPLVIDPVLDYSTYVGGNGSDSGAAIAVDDAGSAYITGTTVSADFPVTGAAVDTTLNGVDAFVTKLNPAGSGLVYSTYLGGTNLEQGFAIAVDAEGSAYVTGRTSSANFPTVSGAIDTTLNGSLDAFVAKLNPAGSGLVYSTYLGGAKVEEGLDIGLDGEGSAYVSGRTISADFPTTVGAFDTSFATGPDDAFVTKLNPAGTTLVYSTYLGGTDLDEGSAIAVDASGGAYLTGRTNSADFPTTVSAFDTIFNGDIDAFVTKLNDAGSALVYSSYLGGGNLDEGLDVALDDGGGAHLTGRTSSADFPTTAAAFDGSYNGGGDGFVTSVNPTGSALVDSTYLGGSGSDQASGIALDDADRVYLIGSTGSADFPTADALDTTSDGVDAFVTQFDSAASTLVHSTYLGGSSSDEGRDIALDGAGNAYITGSTDSADFPQTTGAFDTTVNGGGDAFVSKVRSALDPTDLADLVLSKTAPTRGKVRHPLSYTINLTNTGPETATGVVVTDDLPDGVTFQSASPECSETGGLVTCHLDPLAQGQAVQVTITVLPTVRGFLTNTASVDSAIPDPDPTDDTSTATTEVKGPKKLKASPAGPMTPSAT